MSSAERAAALEAERERQEEGPGDENGRAPPGQEGGVGRDLDGCHERPWCVRASRRATRRRAGRRGGCRGARPPGRSAAWPTRPPCAGTSTESGSPSARRPRAGRALRLTRCGSPSALSRRTPRPPSHVEAERVGGEPHRLSRARPEARGGATRAGWRRGGCPRRRGGLRPGARAGGSARGSPAARRAGENARRTAPSPPGATPSASRASRRSPRSSPVTSSGAAARSPRFVTTTRTSSRGATETTSPETSRTASPRTGAPAARRARARALGRRDKRDAGRVEAVVELLPLLAVRGEHPDGRRFWPGPSPGAGTRRRPRAARRGGRCSSAAAGRRRPPPARSTRSPSSSPAGRGSCRSSSTPVKAMSTKA